MKPSLETIRALLESANISKLSKDTGLHYNTLRYIRDGVIKNLKAVIGETVAAATVLCDIIEA